MTGRIYLTKGDLKMNKDNILGLGLVIVAVILAVSNMDLLKVSEDSIITVSGSYQNEVLADKAIIYLGVEQLRNSAEEAQNSATDVSNKIISELLLLGINKSDISTDYISVYEEKEYVYDKDTGISKSVSKGFKATQTLKIESLDIEHAGKIIDVSVKAGANRVDRVEFSLTKDSEKKAMQVSLNEASKDAKIKAQSIAKAMDVKLKDVKQISESSFSYLPYRYSYDLASKASGAESSSTQIIPEKLKVNANIGVVYYIG